ncbi:hypothetical protein ACTFIZ_011973 [Dictyostelium cf. discoideum]
MSIKSRFTIKCWEKSLKNKKECMICRSEVNSTKDLSRCLVIEQDFGKKECYCIYSFKNYDFIDCENEKISLIKDEENGCKEIINVDQLDSHIKNCKFKFVECSHNGCYEILRLNSLEEHENQCGFKLVKCEYCGCDDTIQKELENHHTECPKFPIDCPQSCSVIIERDQIKSHIENDCNNSTIPCKYYEHGCKVEMKRSELQNHLNNVNHQYFMGLLIEKLSSTLTELHYIQNELVKKVGQSKIISDKLQEKNDELSSLITEKKFTWKFLNSLQYKNEWIISEYSKIVDKFPNGSDLKSPSFEFNSKNSFKSQSLISNVNANSNEFRISIFPNGFRASKDNMSIFLDGNRIKGTNIEFICKLVNVLDKTKSKKLQFKHEFKNIGYREWDWNLGWSHFIESKLITQENGWISKDDKITIKFKVILFNYVTKPLKS